MVSTGWSVLAATVCLVSRVAAQGDCAGTAIDILDCSTFEPSLCTNPVSPIRHTASRLTRSPLFSRGCNGVGVRGEWRKGGERSKNPTRHRNHPPASPVQRSPFHKRPSVEDDLTPIFASRESYVIFRGGVKWGFGNEGERLLRVTKVGEKPPNTRTPAGTRPHSAIRTVSTTWAKAEGVSESLQPLDSTAAE